MIRITFKLRFRDRQFPRKFCTEANELFVYAKAFVSEGSQYHFVNQCTADNRKDSTDIGILQNATCYVKVALIKKAPIIYFCSNHKYQDF